MIKCIIIDDEPLALDLLEDNISKISFLHLSGRFSGINTAVDFLDKNPVDLIFLDINMPQIDGLTFLKSYPVKPMVILVTAFHQHALEGFELDVIDYLLKPVSFERFYKAACKARDRHKSTFAEVVQPTPETNQKYLFVKSEHRILKINFSEIRYIESVKDYVKIFAEGKPVYTLMSLKSLESLLPAAEFVRIHRSYIINLSFITFIGRSKVYIGENGIPISTAYRDSFFELISGGTSGK